MTEYGSKCALSWCVLGCGGGGATVLVIVFCCLLFFLHHVLTPLLHTQKKGDYSPAYEAIRALATDRDALSQCFACSGELRDTLLRIFYSVICIPAQPLASKAPEAPSSRVNAPSNATISAQQATVRHLEAEWPNLLAALRAIHRAPPELSTNDRHRIALLSAFVASETILQAPALNP